MAARAVAQPNAVFVPMKVEFGCQTKPNSRFVAMNIESGCVEKPNSTFMFANIDFGCCATQPRRAASAPPRAYSPSSARSPRRVAANMPHAEFSSRPTL